MRGVGGSPIGEVAARYGTTRESVGTWRKRFKDEGMTGLADRLRRPHHSPSAREVSEAFLAAMRRYGVPAEVLTDNGGQFTGRYLKPQPVEALFERICRENGIKQRLTKPRSPTTTGKIERFHRTLRTEILDHTAALESVDAAQHSINGWVQAYNQHRLHQGIDMATPSQAVPPERSHPPRHRHRGRAGRRDGRITGRRSDRTAPPRQRRHSAVEFEARVPASGSIPICSGRQTVALHRGMAGRTVTVWVDLRSIHISVDGEVIRTLGSRLLPQDLQHLAMRGARRAGPEPSHPALRRTAGKGMATVRAGEAIEIDCTVDRNGLVSIANTKHLVGVAHCGQRVTLRLDGHLIHAIADNVLIGIWPCPITIDRLGQLPGTRSATHPYRCLR